MNPLASIPSASAKLIALTDATTEAQAVLGATTRRISDLNAALGTASTEGAANIEHELSRLRARMSQQQDAYRSRAFIDTAIKNWLQTLPADASLEAAKPIKAKLDKGIIRSAAVQTLREKIAGLVSERQRVRSAGMPVADVKKMAAEYVTRLQARGAPHITVTENRFEIAFDAKVENAYVSKPDLPAILGWLAGPQLLERLHAAIDKQPAPSRTMSAKAKSDRLAQIAAEIAVLEREEEVLIEQSEIEGPIIMRRADASPSAILGVRIKQREAIPA
jgi:hypothetical protein